MAKRNPLSVSISSRNNRDLSSTSGQITQVIFDKKERTQNAIKTFGILIALTFCSVFVPILHYFLVPGLLVASFVFALDKLNETTRNEGGSGECPKCHEPLQIVASKFSERMTDTCGKCREEVVIQIQSAS